MQTEIRRSDILGFIPESAQFAKLNPKGDFVQKFYRINDNDVPEYYGEQGGWHASLGFETEQLTPKNGFLKIVE